MLAPNPSLNERERLAERHRLGVEECKPLLDRSIPLAVPHVEDQAATVSYFARKHARGEFGTFWPLHQVAKGFDVMRSMRSNRK